MVILAILLLRGGSILQEAGLEIFALMHVSAESVLTEFHIIQIIDHKSLQESRNYNPFIELESTLNHLYIHV